MGLEDTGAALIGVAGWTGGAVIGLKVAGGAVIGLML